MTDLGKLLGNNGPKVSKAVTTLAELQAPVGSGAFTVAAFELSGGTGLALLDQPVRLTTGANLTARFGAAGDQEHSVFQEGDSWAPPADQRLAILDLQGKFGIAGSAAPPNPYALSFMLNAAADLRYRHLLSVPGASSRLTALGGLVAGSQLPQLVSVAGLHDGEVHQFTAMFSLALGAEAALGKDLTFKTDLFRGLAPEVSIHFQYTVKASLNASLYEKLSWTVGKGGAFSVNPGWVRMRATRERRHRLTLGTQFALDVEYNFGNVLEALLNRALELNPVARALGALRELQRYNALLAQGDWTAIEGQLDREAADRIAEFLDPILGNSAALKKIVAVSGQVVQAYDNLGETLQSFWDGLLNRGDLAGQRTKLRALLERIKNLPDDPTALLSPAQQDLIPLVEAISGSSLEEIWLESEAGSLLGKVKQDATRALSFLDAVENLPDTALARLTDFAQRTGIQGTLDWIRANATSLVQLKAAANDRVRKLVEKLLNKAFAQLDAADLRKIQEWAQHLTTILAAPEAYEDELRAKLERLNGTVGFKLALEIDRVSRSTALLDIEFDPGDDSTVKAIAGFGRGTLATVLRALPRPDDGRSGTPANLPFLLRECAFTSQRLRTSTRSFWSSLFGTASNTRQRLTELSVDVRQEANAILRKASYSGLVTRATRSVVEKSGHASTVQFSAGAGWTASAQGPGPDLEAPYSSLDQRLRLTITRDDDATTAEELAGIATLLADLGFVVNPPVTSQAADRATRLAVSIELGQASVRGLLGDGTYDSSWDLDYLNAARRWFDEPLTPQTATELNPSDLSRGTLLAGLMREPTFRNGWTKSRPQFEKDSVGQHVTVHLTGGVNVDVVLVFKLGVNLAWGNFNMVRDVIARRHDARVPMRAAAHAFNAAPNVHAGLSRLAESFAAAGEAISPGFWDSPAFAVWLVLARVARTAPESLLSARGLASLRFKDDVTDTWSEPQRWTLDPARLPKRTPGTGIFPIG